MHNYESTNEQKRGDTQFKITNLNGIKVIEPRKINIKYR